MSGSAFFMSNLSSQIQRGVVKFAVWALAPFIIMSGPINAAEEGFKPIFNGKDLSGWEGLAGAWEVRDGAIRCTGQKEGKKKRYAIASHRIALHCVALQPTCKGAGELYS